MDEFEERAATVALSDVLRTVDPSLASRSALVSEALGLGDTTATRVMALSNEVRAELANDGTVGLYSSNSDLIGRAFPDENRLQLFGSNATVELTSRPKALFSAPADVATVKLKDATLTSVGGIDHKAETLIGQLPDRTVTAKFAAKGVKGLTAPITSGDVTITENGATFPGGKMEFAGAGSHYRSMRGTFQLGSQESSPIGRLSNAGGLKVDIGNGSFTAFGVGSQSWGTVATRLQFY